MLFSKLALVGVITLRDIMKGRKSSQMHAPVKGYMTRKVIFARPDITVREMEEILLTNNIGHLPIVEDGKLVGIITRTDYLALRRAHAPIQPAATPTHCAEDLIPEAGQLQFGAAYLAGEKGQSSCVPSPTRTL